MEALPHGTFDNTAEKYQAATKLINDSLGGYLSAVGLVFGLLIAQLYNAVNKRMEHMRDFVTAEAGLLHRSVCTVAALEAQITEAQASTADIISDRMIAYSHALQLEFHDKEMLRWTEEELLRRRTEDLKKLQDVVVHASSLLATARNDAVKMSAKRLIEIAEDLIALRYKRSAEMQQQVLTLTVSVQVWVQAAALFFGVLLLETGSPTFNFILCCFTVMSISLSLWTIADMDLPFSSNFHRVKFESLSVKLLAKPKAPARSVKLKQVASVLRITGALSRNSARAREVEQGAACLSVGFAAKQKRAINGDVNGKLSGGPAAASVLHATNGEGSTSTTTLPTSGRSARVAPEEL